MTSEGRLARGKANYDSKKFLNNSETMDYAKTLKVEKPKEKPNKEVKEEDGKSNKRNS